MVPYDRLLVGYRSALELPVTMVDVLPPQTEALAETQAVIVPLSTGGEVPSRFLFSVTAEEVRNLGFTGATGDILVLPGSPAIILVGLGDKKADGTRFLTDADARAAAVRDAIGLGSRHAIPMTDLGIFWRETPEATEVAAAVEGALLARYRFDALREKPKGKPLAALTLIGANDPDIGAAIEKGKAAAAATILARDLGNAPPNYLTATVFGQVAEDLGASAGLDVTVWDKEDIRREKLGGVLSVNAGSAKAPRVIRLKYVPPGSPTGSLALVGKGVMYDSGGIGLKPNNETHAQMKSDMSGAADVLAAMLALSAVGGRAEVTGYLMCTDNMPSSTATALGDVVTIRGGTTVEVINTDAEGRLVLADGLVLAAEDKPDAMVDIATLTGNIIQALGTDFAGTMGTSEYLVERIRRAGSTTAAPAWQMPLASVYAPKLESTVADLRNVTKVGSPGAVVAALFLHEFTQNIPWAHLDIAGTSWTDTDSGWLAPGCTGHEARLLLEVAADFDRGWVDGQNGQS